MLLVSKHPLKSVSLSPKVKLSLSTLATLPIVREGRTRSGDIVSVPDAFLLRESEGAY
jgi:hypothetical protein